MLSILYSRQIYSSYKVKLYSFRNLSISAIIDYCSIVVLKFISTCLVSSYWTKKWLQGGQVYRAYWPINPTTRILLLQNTRLVCRNIGKFIFKKTHSICPFNWIIKTIGPVIKCPIYPTHTINLNSYWKCTFAIIFHVKATSSLEEVEIEIDITVFSYPIGGVF